MGLGMGCLYACAPLTLIASILLFMIAVMLRSGNWTFEVLAAKNSWETSAKSKACRNGGVIYLCISLVLWLLVLLDSFLIHLEKVPGFVATLWRQRRLPSWRELRRNYRKSNAAATAHISTSRAQPAVDVVLTTLNASETRPSRTQNSLEAGGASPANEDEHAASSSTAAAAAAPPPLASSPLTAQAYASLPGRPQSVLSANTSATTSVMEADHLLS